MNNDAWKPNLFVAGLAKAGSTALKVKYMLKTWIFYPRFYSKLKR